MIPGPLAIAVLAATLGFVACGGGKKPADTISVGGGSGSATPDAAPPPPPDDGYAQEGEVCAVGDRGEMRGSGTTAHPCAEGLSCCYPCGIQGCDSVCMADCGPPRP